MIAPDRIWTSKCGRALVTHQPRWPDDVEYVRADLVDPAAIREAALREAADVVVRYSPLCWFCDAKQSHPAVISSAILALIPKGAADGK